MPMVPQYLGVIRAGTSERRVQADLARGAAFFVLLAVFTGVARLAPRRRHLAQQRQPEAGAKQGGTSIPPRGCGRGEPP